MACRSFLPKSNVTLVGHAARASVFASSSNSSREDSETREQALWLLDRHEPLVELRAPADLEAHGRLLVFLRRLVRRLVLRHLDGRAVLGDVRLARAEVPRGLAPPLRRAHVPVGLRVGPRPRADDGPAQSVVFEEGTFSVAGHRGLQGRFQGLRGRFFRRRGVRGRREGGAEHAPEAAEGGRAPHGSPVADTRRIQAGLSSLAVEPANTADFGRGSAKSSCFFCTSFCTHSGRPFNSATTNTNGRECLRQDDDVMPMG